MNGFRTFTEAEQSPGFLLWRVSTQWRRQVETALGTVGLTHPQFVLLASLEWLMRDLAEVSQVELARYCRMDIATTSQVLRSLEQRGYLERQQRVGNERSKFPHVTESGMRLIKEAIPLVESVDAIFFEKLGPKIETFVQILEEFA